MRKVFLLIGLGLVGLVMIGIGSWMLIAPYFDGEAVIIDPSPPAPEVSQTGIQFTQAVTLSPWETLPPVAATDFGFPTETPTLTPTDAPTPTPTAWKACPEAFLSHLQVGMKGKLSEEPPLPNRVRERASTSATIVGMIQPGEVVEIIDGPGCSNSWVWWKIKKSDGTVGWTAEGDGSDYWLLPLKP